MKHSDGLSAFAGLVDLACSDVGGEALLSSDDFFAGKDNLVRPEEAIFDPDRFTDDGKWMDGWESRRKRVPGHDWCIVKLGVRGSIQGVDIDTSHFLGNHPPFASLDGCVAPAGATPEQLRDEATWQPLLTEVALKRGSHNLFAVGDDRVFTHVKLHIHPDGGVARLRVYGDPRPRLPEGEVIDLALLTHGGRPLACSDMFFAPMHQLLLPERAVHMGHGWETRRSRPPGDDWIIVALGHPGTVERIVLDTNHFKGNYPDSAAVDGIYWPDAPASALIGHPDWTEIVPSTKLRAHEERMLAPCQQGPFTHVRLRIVPDGGISRMGVWGRPTEHTPADALCTWLNGLEAVGAHAALMRCCGSRRWADAMVAARPFTSRTHLFGSADAIWWRLGDGDWEEAFTHHPRLGADPAKLRERFGATAGWSEGEQAGVAGASEELLSALTKANVDYADRFGHLFILCASGLTAQQMLDGALARMDLEPWAELRVAAEEQRKITHLRLAKLETA